MRYNTGNPVGTDGSSDPRDLYDNAGIIDLLMTGPLAEYLNRLGVPLKSWVGIMQQVTDYLIAQGYESIYLAYGAGVVVERQTQLVQRSGELYRVMNAADIPLTLTGTWSTDAPKLQAVGDYALRQALANTSDPYLGSAMVGRQSLIINHVTELRATPGRFNGDRAMLLNYNADDKKGRGRCLTWVAGSGAADDGGMRFAATGGVWFSDLNIHGEADAEYYGLPVGASTDAYDKLEALMNYCIANKSPAYIGPGPLGADPVYDTFERSFPLSGPRNPGQPLTDFGFYVRSHPNVTFRTSSTDGADVFNICSMSNWSLLGFPRITGSIAITTGSGSNGVSMVYGGKNITIEAVVESMPTVWLAGGGTDGGHGFTIQPGAGNTNEYSNIVFRGYVKGCTTGFNIGINTTNAVSYPISGVLLDDLEIEECYQGITIGGTAPTASIADPRTLQPCAAIMGSARIKNCQQGYIEARGWGTMLDVSIVNTKDKSALIKNPNSTSVEVCRITGSKHGKVSIDARVQSVDKVVTLGAATMGGQAFPSTEAYELDLRVRYTSATTEFDPADITAPSLRQAEVRLYGLVSVPSTFISNCLNSSIHLNGSRITPTRFPGDSSLQSPGGADAQIIYTAPLTAARTISAPISANIGDRLTVVRKSAATGSALTYTPAATNIAAGATITFIYDGSAWSVV